MTAKSTPLVLTPPKLQPSDVLVDVDESKSIFARIKRWFLGCPFTHVRMYYGTARAREKFLAKQDLGSHLFYESRGRGVMFTQAEDFIGQKVVVMRLRERYDNQIPAILEYAFEIATDEQSSYDYFSIPKFIIPRLIFEKLGLPLPLKYQRNPFMICSEAVAEPPWRAGVCVLPKNMEPLPGDFVRALDYYKYMGTGEIAPEMFE